jgi:hypothetical protein
MKVILPIFKVRGNFEMAQGAREKIPFILGIACLIIYMLGLVIGQR